MMAFSQFQRCLRPAPPTPPDHWSAPAPPSPLQSPPHQPYPSRNCLSCAGRFGAAPTQGQHIRNPHRTGTSPSRRGERYHHTHSRLHPASRPQTLIRPGGVMRVSSSAPQPAAAPLHPPHPSPSTRTPSSGSKASLFVFRDSGADAPAALHTPRKPRRHGVRKGKMRPAVRILPAAEQSASGLHRSSPGLGTVSGSAVHRPSAQNGRAAAHATAPQIFSNIAMLICTPIRNRVRLFHLTFIYYLLNPIPFVVILIFKIVYLIFIPRS